MCSEKVNLCAYIFMKNNRNPTMCTYIYMIMHHLNTRSLTLIATSISHSMCCVQPAKGRQLDCSIAPACWLYDYQWHRIRGSGFNITFYQGPFSISCSEYAQAVLGHSQGRLLQYPGLWLSEHSPSLLQARDRKRPGFKVTLYQV